MRYARAAESPRHWVVGPRREIVAARLPRGSGQKAMIDGAQPVSFTPERYRREAARVRREAETAGNEDVRRQLMAIAEQFDAVAETMERADPAGRGDRRARSTHSHGPAARHNLSFFTAQTYYLNPVILYHP